MILNIRCLILLVVCSFNLHIYSDDKISLDCVAKAQVDNFVNFPVDITFVIFDIKYNQKDGVKICEMQPGVVSVFSGYDYLTGGDGAVPDMFCDLIAQYQNNVWYIEHDICDKKSRIKFSERGWIKARNLKDILNDEKFIQAANSPVEDPYNIRDYHGLLYVRPSRIASLEDFKKQYPGILVMDAAYFPHLRNKSVMDQLLKSTPKLNNLRPLSNLYSKKYSNELVKTISNEIASPIIVIKPINSTKGQGVIIIEKNDLKSTLAYILRRENNKKLRKDPDLAYRYWADDTNKTFLVEEFIESIPVSVPQFNNMSYNGTLRAVVMLTYNQGKIETQLLEGHWKLPKKSISDEGTLTEKHKSYGAVPHFLIVEPEILKIVQSQLSEGFEELYGL